MNTEKPSYPVFQPLLDDQSGAQKFCSDSNCFCCIDCCTVPCASVSSGSECDFECHCEVEEQDGGYFNNTSDYVCRVCGCDDLNACPGGCWWVSPDLCSTCFDSMPRFTFMGFDRANGRDQSVFYLIKNGHFKCAWHGCEQIPDDPSQDYLKCRFCHETIDDFRITGYQGLQQFIYDLKYYLFRKWFPKPCPECKKRYKCDESCDSLPF